MLPSLEGSIFVVMMRSKVCHVQILGLGFWFWVLGVRFTKKVKIPVSGFYIRDDVRAVDVAVALTIEKCHQLQNVL